MANGTTPSGLKNNDHLICGSPLKERTAEIGKLTGEIIGLETLLNAEVYAAFGLNDDEIRLIEEETKYNYGEW
jgi:hypothetical protein